jgi:peroxiredoxin
MTKRIHLEIAMTLRITLIAAALALAVPALAAPIVGKPAPDFSVADANGQTQSLAAYKGRTVVLEWNNPECPFVRKHYGAKNMQEQQAEAASEGVVWLTVNSGAVGKQGHLDASAANAYVARVGGKEAAYLIDADGKVGRAYDAKTTPHMYVIDKDGVLRYMGGIDSIASTDEDDIPKATQYVRQALAEMRQGKAVSVPTSEPYGCSVKYGS